MAGERPRLEVLSGGPEAQETPAPAASPATPASRRESGTGWVLAALLALLGVAVVALAIQTRRATTLSDEVEALKTELAHTQTVLEAHRGHLSEVRGAVEQLRELVLEEPSAAPDKPAPGPESP